MARALLHQAATQGGRADALAALGDMAERGEGLPGPDLRAAAQRYSEAAAAGSRDATTALAHMMVRGCALGAGGGRRSGCQVWP